MAQERSKRKYLYKVLIHGSSFPLGGDTSPYFFIREIPRGSDFLIVGIAGKYPHLARIQGMKSLSKPRLPTEIYTF
jgi:hypothetical protein